MQRYRDNLQLVIRRCRQAVEDDRRFGFDEAALIPSAAESLDVLWRRLTALLDDNLERPQSAPARRPRRSSASVRGSRSTPRRRRSTTPTAAACSSTRRRWRGSRSRSASTTRELDRDLILIGVLFHDLGKIFELGAMPANDYTTVGRLVGHVVLGRDLLREGCAAIPDFPTDLQLHLEHLVLSHQGQRDWGSPVEPSTTEALALSFIDDLDSKLAQLRAAQQQGAGFQYLRALGRHVLLRESAEEGPGTGPPTSEGCADAEEGAAPATGEAALPAAEEAPTAELPFDLTTREG